MIIEYIKRKLFGREVIINGAKKLSEYDQMIADGHTFLKEKDGMMVFRVNGKITSIVK